MKTDNLAPIIVFAFNRCDSLERLIASLLLNSEAKDSELFLFVDGPRDGNGNDKESINKIREYVATIKGFKSFSVSFSEKNKGLGPSLISGITQVIDENGKAIILEDDLQVTSNFLAFMNKSLDKYKDVGKVFSVCGYSNIVHPDRNYTADTYFCTRSSSWGWATWKDRWDSVDWELKNWKTFKKYSHAFCKWGGSDCWHMLSDWKKGKNSSWAIRFCFAQFLQEKLSLFPIKSKIIYNGNDGRGTNSKKYSRFKFEVDNNCSKDFSYPASVEINKKLYSQAMHYHSIPLRIWSRLMYMATNIKTKWSKIIIQITQKTMRKQVITPPIASIGAAVDFRRILTCRQSDERLTWLEAA